MMPATNAIRETLMTPRANSDAINAQQQGPVKPSSQSSA
jgi:hypothetical protein